MKWVIVCLCSMLVVQMTLQLIHQHVLLLAPR